MGIGTNLKNILNSKGMSFKELSEQTGISVNTLYSMTRRDANNLRSENLKKICSVLNIETTDLIPLRKAITRVNPYDNSYDTDYILDSNNYVVHSEFEKYISNLQLSTESFNMVRSLANSLADLDKSSFD